MNLFRAHEGRPSNAPHSSIQAPALLWFFSYYNCSPPPPGMIFVPSPADPLLSSCFNSTGSLKRSWGELADGSSIKNCVFLCWSPSVAHGFHCHANVTVGASRAEVWILTETLALQFALNVPPPHKKALKKLSLGKGFKAEFSSLLHFGRNGQRGAQTGLFQREEEKEVLSDLTLLLFNYLIIFPWGRHFTKHFI